MCSAPDICPDQILPPWLSVSTQKLDTATLQRVLPVCKRYIAVHGSCPRQHVKFEGTPRIRSLESL